MAQPRKTLGGPEAPCAQALLGLIRERDKKAVAAWAIACAEERVLQVFERACPGDGRVREALGAVGGWLLGTVKFPAVKGIILNRAHQAARELDANPAAQAAACACAQAASAIHVREHAMGLLYYGAAALAYEALGTDGDPDAYRQVFEGFAQELTVSIMQVPID